MSPERMDLPESDLEQVVGGLFSFNGITGILTYTHKDGSETKHKLLDAKAAWALSNQLHGQLIPEDEILAQLIQAGYVAG